MTEISRKMDAARGVAAIRLGLSRWVVLAAALSASACVGTPPQTESLDYRARAETQVDGRVQVSAVVLSPRESEAASGLPLAREDVQPVWLEINNQEDRELYLMLLSLDPDYFAPSEVAWQFRSYGSESLEKKASRLLDLQIPVVIPPQRVVSGYVYTHLDPGAKAFAVELFGESMYRTFEFVQRVPGFEADFQRINFHELYREEEIRDLTMAELPAYLEQLPCCVAGGDRKTPGDPLNLVIVGEPTFAIATLVSRGWDLTETNRSGTAWRTIRSSLFGSKYRTSPISPLYVFGRPQDIALQKARDSVDERNHLRLWLAPVTVEGGNVWVGQISRDIGVKFSSKTFVTHKIDPVVDEARLYVALDLAASQSLRFVGYVKGVGTSTPENPRYNYTDDPYFTDGLRVVLFVERGPFGLDELGHLPWERPVGRTRDEDTKD